MPAVRGKINLYELFICRAIALANLHGALSLITPMALLGDNQTRGIRHRILTGKEIRTIESFPQKDDIRRRVFPEAKLSTAVFVVKGECSGQAFAVRTHPGRLIETQSQALQIRPDQISAYDPDNIAIPSCTQRDWDIAMKILGNDVIRMSMIADHNQGEVNETTHSRFLFAEGDGPTVLRGAAISMYAVREASQGAPLVLDAKSFVKGSRRESKAWDHQHRRVGFQRSSPQNNFRRLIAAPIPSGEFCFDTVSYVTEVSSSISLDLLILLLNSKILDWYFRLGSTNSKVNEYQFNSLPVVKVSSRLSNTGRCWNTLVNQGHWSELESLLFAECTVPGILPANVGEALIVLSRRIQTIEANRKLRSRSERSHLAPKSQSIQDLVDRVLFRCYGLLEEDAEYVEKRLGEML